MTFTRYVRPYGEVRAIMIDRAHGRVANRNPFEFTDAAEVERAFAGLRSLDPAEWVGAFGAVATEHAERARAAEGRGDPATAKTEWLAAYNFERVARYPAPSSPAKAAAYAREAVAEWGKAVRYAAGALRKTDGPSLKDRLNLARRSSAIRDQTGLQNLANLMRITSLGTR